jgi:protein TonB
MKQIAIILACVLLGACNTMPDYTGPFRPDVLYYRDTYDGRQSAAEVKRLFDGKQEVVLISQRLPEMRFPVPQFRAQPEYPGDLKAKGVSGEVLVEFVISETGEVLYATVVRSSEERLNAAAIDAIRKWRFRPAQYNGFPVRCLLQQPFIFSIDDSK